MKALIAALALTVAFSAVAAEPLAGEQIRALVSGKTVDGTMTDTGRYAEFYAADGQIRGKDYVGVWTIEGDAMCFVYPDVEKACWQVGVSDGEIQWIRDGVVLGVGAATEGNVNGF
jgi:hypothetical protein